MCYMTQLKEYGTTMDLVHYRLSSAEDDLRAARILYEAGEYRGANNRAYYALFHAINAVHALHGMAYKRHKDAIANFNKDYVKTGIFPRDIGRKIGAAEEIRHASDYDDFYLASKEETQQQIATAQEFLTIAGEYCETNGKTGNPTKS